MNYSLDSVSKQYVLDHQTVPALKRVSFSICKGEAMAILGSSGAGKTTLFRLLNATLRPTSGFIRVDGRELGRMSTGELRRTRRRIGTVYQQHHLVPSLTALENTLCGCLGRWSLGETVRTMLRPARADLKEALQALELVDLADKRNARADELSGGQQQRLAIARVLMQKPEVILADEPVASLDPLGTVFRALVSTVATAIAGTILSILIAVPLGALATPVLWRRGILSVAHNRSWIGIFCAAASRAVLALLGFLRAVPDLVWGLLFVSAVGLGSLAGVLALAVAYAGVLGRVYADVFAHVDSKPLEALQATGATRAQVFLRGIWPQALPNATAYTLYSCECSVRAASVLSFVGAGGIGYEISLSMRLFDYRQVMTLIFAFVLLLGLTDVVSRRVRARLRPNAGSIRQRQTVRTWQFGWGVLGYAVALGIVVGSFYLAGFSPKHLGESNIARNMLRFYRGMVPPDFAKGFVWGLGPLLVQTLAISILGTVMGMVLGGILAVPATSTLVFVQADSPGARSRVQGGLRWSLFWAARFLLNLLRSIPDLVWVLVCILLVGIGPFAGTLAIGLHTAGVLGKLYAETLEEVQVRPVEALRALGARPLQLLAWALWPQAKPMVASYTVLRWEANLRVSAILGAVGGGALGQAIYNNVQLGFYSRLATLLLVVCLLVMASDWIGDKISHGAVGA